MLPSIKGFKSALDGLGIVPNVMVEIGAMYCDETLEFSRIWPDASIYSYECNPETLPRCRDTVNGNPRIKLIEKAVCDHVGEVDFYACDTARSVCPQKDGNPGTSSVFPRNHEIEWCGEVYPQIKMKVPCTTLESEFSEHGWPSIDALWMDAQAAELMILKSAGPRLSDIKVILTEVEFKEEYVGQPLWGDVKCFLEFNGFRFHGWAAPPWLPYAGDAIFSKI